MSMLTQLVLALLPRFPTQEALDAQYLNESVDVLDLERRQRELDTRHHTQPSSPRIYDHGYAS